jgi:hypothetical protein
MAPSAAPGAAAFAAAVRPAHPVRSGARRRGAIDLRRGALDHLGLALLILCRGAWRRVRDLRQPGIEPRNGVVELAGDGGLAARHLGAHGFAARHRLRDLLDLAGDGVEPLMDVGDLAALPALHRLPLLLSSAVIRRARLADGGIEPIVERHAGAARRRLGPFADGGIDAVNTPRYARIHDSVRSRLRRCTLRPQPPRAFPLRDNRILRGSSASAVDFFPSR